MISEQDILLFADMQFVKFVTRDPCEGQWRACGGTREAVKVLAKKPIDFIGMLWYNINLLCKWVIFPRGEIAGEELRQLSLPDGNAAHV